MSPYKKILIATDGSLQTGKAVKQGIELAKLLDAKLYVVFVIDTSAFDFFSVDTAVEKAHDLLREKGEKITGAVEEMAKENDVDVRSEVLVGQPAIEIVNFAEEGNIDLIVMGTLGKAGIERFLLGSVSEKVIRTSPVPVMVVRNR
ncbi:MAG: universal stress protein [Methanosarcinales archaeon Met12]|nr:MAG: universal stress protein [Methanosarcinales archaeon Met12]